MSFHFMYCVVKVYSSSIGLVATCSGHHASVISSMSHLCNEVSVDILTATSTDSSVTCPMK